MRKLSISLTAVAALLIAAGGASAATTPKDLTITANVASAATLSLGTTTMSLSLADTSTTATGTLTIDAKARIGSSGSAVLTVASAGTPDFSGGTTNPLNAIVATTSDTGFSSHAVSATPATLATWTNSGQHAATYNYSLPNSWDYVAGNYSATVTYTLTTP